VRDPRRPQPLQQRIFSRSLVHRRGLLTPADLRSTAWQRLYRGAYADADLPVSHGLRCAAAHLVLPPEAAIGGRSAAWLHGVRFATADDPVEVVVPRGARFGPVRGLTIRLADLPADDMIPGRPAVTTPVRTAWDLARFLDVPTSVSYLDAMAARRLFSIAELGGRAEHCAIAWGRKRARQAIELIDFRSESPQESRLRASLVLAGLPPPVVQYTVLDGGRFVARVDLAWPERRVAVEYDGLWHGTPAQFHRDRRRLNALVAAGWTVIHVTSTQLRTGLDQTVRQIRTALAR
jgi:hypothetical protein